MLKRFFLVSFLLLGLMAGAVQAADLFQLVPADAAFVLNVNLGKILTTDAVKKQVAEGMAKQTPEQKKAFDEFVTKTGIDPLTHLKSIFVFVSGKTDPDPKNQQAGVLVDGTFNIDKILTAIKADPKAKEDVIIEKFEGFDAIRSQNKGDGMGVFLDGTTAVIGSVEGVGAVVNIKKGKAKGIADGSKLGSLVKNVNTGAMVWGAGVIPPELKAKAKENPQAAPLAALNFLHFAFNMDDNLTFDFAGEVDKKENMDGVMTSLNGFLAMIKMLAGQTPEAGEVLNMIKVESVETTAKISLSVPRAKLDEIRQKIEARLKQAAPAPAPTKE